MNKMLLSVCGLLAGASLSSAQTIAQWTFEGTAITATTAASFTYGSPETGSGTASGVHASASTAWSSPAGDGSAHSLSANGWAVGDYYQFQTTTLGYTGIQLDWDQTSSGTGPGKGLLQWSTDGSTFHNFGSDYSILVNGSPNIAWSSGTYQPAFHYTVDLSTVSELNNASSVYFRLADDATTSANGGTVASGGTDRIDNFTVSVAPVPEPGSVALLGLGLAGMLALRRRR